MRELIEDTIRSQVRQANEEGRLSTRYREPLIGYAAAHDPLFEDLRRVAWEGHMTPSQLLPGARTVVAFFLPFEREVVLANRRLPRDQVAREWAVAYVETNAFIAEICLAVKRALESRGVACVFQKPTENYDRARLMAPWSHKHVAYVAGLGTFGVNQMLITPAGCAGRIGTLVLDAPLEPGATPTRSGELCLIKAGEECGDCIGNCPVGALSETGFDRYRCHQRVLEVGQHFPELERCHVCGKCALGRCAMRAPGNPPARTSG